VPDQPQNTQLNNLIHQGQPIAGMLNAHTGDVQTDILRIQENIINSIRQLHAQHSQLEQLQSLLGELHRVQQATGVAPTAQLPNIQPLNPTWGPTGVQRAYLPVQGQAAIGPGDAGLPEGLTLPAGYTLRRLAPVQPTPTEGQTTITAPLAPQRPSSEHIRRALYPEVYSNSTQQNRQGPQASTPGVSGATASAVTPSAPAVADGPAQATQPGTQSGEVHSGWNFGDLDPTSTASAQTEGSSSAPPSVPHQATVEDSEDRNE
jgi:E3 ubiquitin-protein ligase synoviolin